MDFIELKIVLPPQWVEICIAELAEIGYESFAEFDEGVTAYVQKSAFDAELWQEIVERYKNSVDIQYEISEVKRKNWNEEWEKNYSPIFIEDECIVRATFHEHRPEYQYEIVINPQMSFGTGHHETTSLMLQNQLQVAQEGLRVMDAGSGTGILAIMASKRGASHVDAFDIDEWAVTNATENVALNGCTNIRVQQGTIATVSLAEAYEVILANINRNILLEEMPIYVQKLTPEGMLLLSGFYEQDIPELEQRAVGLGLVKRQQTSKQQWACLLFQKK